MSDLVKQLLKNSESLFTSSERNLTENRWAIQSKYLLNNQSGNFQNAGNSFTTITLNKGVKRTQGIYDTTGLEAVHDLASAYQSTLLNFSNLQVKFLSEKEKRTEEERIWLQQANHIMVQKLSDSNLDSEAMKAFLSFVALDNCVLMQEYDIENNEFNFKCYHLSQVAWNEDVKGNVDEIYIKLIFTAKQAFSLWGSKLNTNILQCLDSDSEKEFEFLHVIKPRDKFSKGLVPADKRPIGSYFIDTKNRELVEEGGYYERPVFVARALSNVGERYGRGRADMAMPEVLTINKYRKLDLEAKALRVKPPIFVNENDILDPKISLGAGAITVVKDVRGITPYNSGVTSAETEQVLEIMRQTIRRLFFLDKLVLPPRDQIGEMTAHEVSTRTAQMFRVLGSTLTRIKNELLNPMITRSFNILFRNGIFPDAPANLARGDFEIDIVFNNELARSQQAQEIQIIQQWLNIIAGIAQFSPEILINVDFDEISRYMAVNLGVPDIALRSQEEVDNIRQQAQEQQQEQQGLNQMQQLSDINKNLGQGE